MSTKSKIRTRKLKNYKLKGKGKGTNLVLFDIECTNLSSNFGYILSIAWKTYGENEVKWVAINDFPSFKKDPTNDKAMLKVAGEELSKADILCGHYSSKFDVPYMNSRLLYHGLELLPPVPHIDTWRIARYKMKLNSNRLQSVTAFLGMEDKTPLDGPTWIRAMAGHKSSIDYVVEHNIQDVVVLEQVYEKIKPLMVNHPNMNCITETVDKPRCPVCSSDKVQKRGFHVSNVSRTQRYHCQNCGHWSKGAPKRVKGIEVRG